MLNIRDVYEDKRFSKSRKYSTETPRTQSEDVWRAHSVLIGPVEREGRIVGCIEMINKKSDPELGGRVVPFTKNDVGSRESWEQCLTRNDVGGRSAGITIRRGIKNKFQLFKTDWGNISSLKVSCGLSNGGKNPFRFAEDRRRRHRQQFHWTIAPRIACFHLLPGTPAKTTV